MDNVVLLPYTFNRTLNNNQDISQYVVNRRFDEKLHDDAPALCADGFADADLSGALGDGDQHDMHVPQAGLRPVRGVQ